MSNEKNTQNTKEQETQTQTTQTSNYKPLREFTAKEEAYIQQLMKEHNCSRSEAEFGYAMGA